MHIPSALLGAFLVLAALPLGAAEISDQLAIGGVLSAAVQCQRLSGKTSAPDSCRGAAPFQPDLTYRPTDQDELFLKLGLAAGNALNPVSPFSFPPWSADLQADVKHINGRNRGYLLEAWYSHTFQFASDSSLEVTGGIIDPAFYVDENAYANNEYTQFMNGAFVNARDAFLPGYDWGGVLVWKYQDWTFTAVGMNVGENEDGRNYNFYAAEADYHVETPLGEGNYRVLYSGTSNAYLNPAGSRLERRAALSLSFDQALGEVVGAFLRLGRQSETPEVDYKALYSGGLDFKGTAWGRPDDNIGIGYAYLPGGSGDIAHSHIFETYYRLVVDEHLALSADVQYMADRYRDGDGPKGWIGGLRLTLEF